MCWTRPGREVPPRWKWTVALAGSAAVAWFVSRRKRSRQASETQGDAGDLRRVGLSSKRVPPKIDVIIIGSGAAGLACAATLAKSAGLVCVVLEQHDVAGGSTHVFDIQHNDIAAEFDTGLHYIGSRMWESKSTLRQILDWLGNHEVKWAPMDTEYDHAVLGSERFAVPAGKSALREMLVSKFPDEAQAIDAYFGMVSQQQSCAGLFFGARLAAALLPQILSPLIAWLEEPHARISDKTVAEVLDAAGCSKKLRGLITYHWGNMGLPPGRLSFATFAMMANHYFEGACYPIGGSGGIAQALCKCITRHGGRVFVRAPVQRILTDEATGRAVGVELRSGKQLHARVGVVSTAGARATFDSFLPADEKRVALLRTELKRIQPSVQHLQLFIILKPMELPAANWWICPGGFDHDLNWTRAAEDELAPDAAAFISFPSAKDPTWSERYPTSSTCIIIAGSSFERFARWEKTRVKHRGAVYEEYKERLSQKLLEVLFREFPHLRDKVLYYELGTPLTTQFYLGAPQGESYGLECTGVRYRSKWLRPGTPIPGLWLAGQDVLSPGVCGALASGFLTALAVRPILALRHIGWVSSL